MTMSKPDPKRSLDGTLTRWNVPTQQAEDADAFAENVARAIRRLASLSAERRVVGWRRWGWSLAIGCAVVALLAFVLLPTRPPGEITVDDQPPVVPATDVFAIWQGVKQLFPGRLAVLELQNGETSLAVSEFAIATDAAPVLVRLCRAGECRSFVTVSGQEITAFGERFEVFEEADGGIIVASDRVAWSNHALADISGEVSIDARVLEARQL